jgi:hypothetical protein
MMSKDVPRHGDDHAAGPAAGTVSAEAEGGEAVCWAHLVCPECGAMTSEGHRQACSLAAPAASEGS